MIRPVGAPEAVEGAEAGGQGAPETGEEEAMGARQAQVVSDDAAAAIDDGAPVGPSEGEEASFLAEQRIASGVALPPARDAGADRGEDEPAGSLPPLEDLVSRIPAPTRALLDELFRAKFVTVKRVPKSALK
jgi:hypothetical protein